jgi:hypothetical protein
MCFPLSVTQHFNLTVLSCCESQTRLKTIKQYTLKYIKLISQYFSRDERTVCNIWALRR